MVAAVVAPSLGGLRSELNAKYPKRDKTSDGWIGDRAHSKTKSDHNPNHRGRVCALDIDKDGINVKWLISILIKDPRVNYVIFNRVIWSRSRGFKPRKYNGPNPHDKHLHVSILQTRAAEENTKPWFKASDNKPVKVTPVKPKVKAASLELGDKGNDVVLLQRALGGLKVDGDFGKLTDKRVRAYQKANGLVVDGIAGTKTLTKLKLK